MNKTSRFFVIGIVSTIAVVAIAQSSSNSSSQSGGQTGSAWGSASSSSSGFGQAGGSHSGGQTAGGFQGGGTLVTPNYVVMLQRNPRAANTQGDQAFWREEVAYWQQLTTRGAATMAGNWREWDGGLILLNVRDDQTAQAIADNDPGVRKGILVATVRAFEVRAVGTNFVPSTGAKGGFGGATVGGGTTRSGNSGGSASGGTSGGGGGGSTTNSSGGGSGSGSNSGGSGGGTSNGGKTKSGG